MRILLLCEPRSGSTNFANWFSYDKRFSVLFNATDSKSRWYKKEGPENYKYKTEYLIIKEDFYPFKKYSNLIEKSEKVIFLFRENEKEQIESWCNSIKTGNWDKGWIWKESNYSLSEESFFKELKNKFRGVLEKNRGISISYEDLYTRSGIDKIVDYLEIDELDKKKWPIGEKYRSDVTGRKNFI
jgi:hypothetical protein